MPSGMGLHQGPPRPALQGLQGVPQRPWMLPSGIDVGGLVITNWRLRRQPPPQGQPNKYRKLN
jgi:hypothetical protein